MTSGTIAYLSTGLLQFSLFVAFLFNQGKGEINYLGEVGCDKHAENLGCHPPRQCTITCVQPCNQEGSFPVVWGTRMYTYDSPVCRAAFHDFRLTPWSASRNVTFQRNYSDPEKYLASIQFGAVSAEYGRLGYQRGYFYFTSPYMAEDILDVATVNFNFLYNSSTSSTFKQTCSLDGKARTYYLNFRYFVPEVITKNGIPKSYDGRMYWHEVSWSYPDLQPGGYWCNLHNNSLSDTLSLAMRADAQFTPAVWTIRVSVRENVVIKFTENQKVLPFYGYVWRKNNRELRFFKNMFKNNIGNEHSLEINSVDVGDTGIYSLEFKQKSFYERGARYEKRGIMRLIVRRCENGYFGSFCQNVCPECLNGGICHDIMGTCLCPPGFIGTFCENACPEGYFGEECSKSCALSEDTNVADSCRGVLICLPDPYGCSCAAGFKGLSCTESCSPGEYGASCLQKRVCHCFGNELCNVKSGLCLRGCAEGWRGPACNISYPLLLHPPILLEPSSNSLKVEFSSWDKTQLGEGQPALYYVEFKEKNELHDTWTISQIFRADSLVMHGNIATVSSLQPATTYAVRVVIQDEDKNTQRELAPVTFLNTSCAKPSLPPDDIRIDVTLSGKVQVSWTKPPISTWNCQVLSVTLKYSNSEETYTQEGLTDNSFAFYSTPYTKWTVMARLDTSNDEHSDWTNPISGVTAQDAPGKVQNLKFQSLSDVFLITWEKPSEENGVIKSYYIQVTHTEWKHPCQFPIMGMNFSTSASDYKLQIPIKDLKASSVYKVSVMAMTIKIGQPEDKIFHTKESIPDGRPQNIYCVKTEQQIMVKWDPPPCELINGFVSNYFLTFSGQEQWDNKQRNLTSRIPSVQLSDLIPYTTYSIRIHACSNEGCSEKYRDTTEITKSKSPPEPGNVTIYRTTETTLFVTWKPPYPPYGKLKNYSIYYKERNEHKFHNFQLNATGHFCGDTIRQGWVCYSISDLQPQKCYTLYIVAENDAGKSMSSQVSGETEESVPDPPAFVYVNTSTENSLEVSWQEPYRSNGNLTGYRINVTVIKSYSAPELANTQILSANLKDVMLNVSGLLPATEYNISISASTKKGHGNAVWNIFKTRNAEPEIHEEPKIGLVTKNTVDLLMKPLLSAIGPIDAYYVLVEQIGNLRRKIRSVTPSTSLLVDYNTSQAEGLSHYAAAKFLPSEVPSQGFNLTVGDGRMYGGYFNAPLLTGKKYNFGMAILSNYSGDVAVGYRYVSNSVTVEDMVASSLISTTGAVVGSIVILVLLCIVAVLFVIYKQPKWIQNMKRSSISKLPVMSQKQLGKGCVTESTISLETAITEAPVNHITSHCIPVDKLENYVQTMTQNGVLEEEYKAINKKPSHSVAVSKFPENKSKNRYGNLLPYDHSRVILEKIHGDNFSNYINASYISGYDSDRKYIATQGPKQSTVNDFWRMIWQEEVNRIIMATNLKEHERVKCEKYWPESSESYGVITVTLLDTEMYADYVLRTFEVIKENDHRQIRQFHFTSWPDHGVPLYPIAIGGFLKHVHAYKNESQEPIVIHCSAGVGRTGTIILIDSMIEMGRAENQVDILGHLHKIREQRMNLVETYEQYEFVLRALADILCGEETSILCREYYEVLAKLQQPDQEMGKSLLQLQYERLNKLCSPLQCQDCKTGHAILNKDKNRSSSIVPPDSSRYLLPTSNSSSNYINAVYVHGYKQKDSFLVTQIPRESGQSDFWKMIHGSKTSAIVLLHNTQQSNETIFWSEGTSQEYESLVVEHVESEAYGDITMRTFNLRNTSKKNPKVQIVRQFHLENWNLDNQLSSPQVMTDLIERVERWQKQHWSPSIVVQCLDGASASGIFCASVFICDKIKVEQEVDVFLAVRSIRSNRPQFILNLEQYISLHQVASTFLDSFETYANFQ